MSRAGPTPGSRTPTPACPSPFLCSPPWALKQNQSPCTEDAFAGQRLCSHSPAENRSTNGAVWLHRTLTAALSPEKQPWPGGWGHPRQPGPQPAGEWFSSGFGRLACGPGAVRGPGAHCFGSLTSPSHLWGRGNPLRCFQAHRHFRLREGASETVGARAGPALLQRDRSKGPGIGIPRAGGAPCDRGPARPEHSRSPAPAGHSCSLP